MPSVFRRPGVVLATLVSIATTPATGAVMERPTGPRQHTFALFDATDGLDSLTTFDLQLDHDGNLWIATQEGLVHFDGERFRTFRTPDGLPSGVVFDIEQAGDGTLWAATLKGLARRVGTRFEPVALPDSPAGEAIEVLSLDDGGNLIAGAVGGAYRCTGASCERIFELPADQFVSAIALDPNTHELWFGGPFGLARWRGQEIERFTRERGLPSHATRALLVDRVGGLWVRQIRDVVRVDTNDGSVEVFDLPPAADSSRLFLDSRGVVWITSDSGLYHREGDRWERIGLDEGLPDAAVSAVAEDREGALWIGLAHAGLARWLGRDRFVSWTAETGLPSDVIWAVERTTDRRLAFGTQAGLAVVSPGGGTVKNFAGDPLLGDGPILSLCAAPRGGLWAGGATGRLAYLSDDDQVFAAGPAAGFGEDVPITAIRYDAAGELWLATNAGLWVGEGEAPHLRFHPVAVPNGTKSAAEPATPELFVDLLLDHDGAIWAAGRYGLARFAEGSWRRLTTRDGLLDDFLLSLAEDRDGRLWIGYRDARGISSMTWNDGQPQFEHYDHRQGLRHDQVTFVRTDALGRVWVGTTRGISVRNGRRFVSFRRSDGLISEDTSSNAFLAEPDGTTWIGTPHGAIAARISAADLAPRRPLTARILGATLGGEPFEPPAEPRAGHDHATFEVNFAARTFRTAREVEFRYQLSEADPEPVVTAQRSARYPALPPGRHEFRVAARTEGRDWGPEATLSFEILPPWWATLPARLGALLLAILIGLTIDRLRSRRERRHSEQLERSVAERTEELKASRQELSRKNEELAELSLVDPLTGLKNRRFAWEYLAREVARIEDERQRLTEGEAGEARLVFFLMDVDLFKTINDLHGHEIGDLVLIEVAERVREATRIHDVAVRWGGEEFLVVARDLPPSEWAPFAARLRETIASAGYQPSKSISPVHCTVSLGYAGFPFDAENRLPWHQVLRLADQALYAVKQCGRNADLGVEPGRSWSGAIPSDLLAGQASGAVHLSWGNAARTRR